MPIPMDLNERLDINRWDQFRAELNVLDARDSVPRPISVDEMLVQIPRDKYRTLLELACEALRVRCGAN